MESLLALKILQIIKDKLLNVREESSEFKLENIAERNLKIIKITNNT